MTRMFVAVVPPAEVLAAVRAAVDGVRDVVPGLRWGAPEQWHVTLAFLGDVDPGAVDALSSALDDVARDHGPFRASVRSAGAFPRVRSARVLWAGVTDDGGRLGELAGAVTTACAEAGAGGGGASDRPGHGPAAQRFNGHLTLARAVPPRDLTVAVDRLGGLDAGPWPVQELVLVESRLGAGPGGRARHEVRQAFRLRGRPGPPWDGAAR